jgi:hypothetical protein
MRITDLLDDYQEDSIPMITGVPTPAPEEVLNLTRKKLGRSRVRRVPVLVLVAALVAMLSISAGAAYYIGHEKTANLVASGISTGGAEAVELDDTAREVIDTASQDYGMTVTDSGASVTLDSIMGFHAEDMSVLYITLTIQPPEGTQFTADIQACGFLERTTQLTTEALGGSSYQSALWNEDGTISAMLLHIYQGDVGDCGMTLHLGGFGNVSKAVIGDLYSGAREIEVPGDWEFQIDSLNLDTPITLSVDASLFQDSDLSPASITLSSFGGMLTLHNTAGDISTTMLRAHQEELRALLPDQDLDNITWSQITSLYESGAISQEEMDEIDNIIGEVTDINVASTLQLIYPDGSVYPADATVWSGVNAYGQFQTMFQFAVPQDVSQAEYLSLDGVIIPIHTEP